MCGIYSAMEQEEHAGKNYHFDGIKQNELAAAIGATPVNYAFKNECCGAYVSTTQKDLAVKKSHKVTDSAKAAGAEKLVTACPLCMYNLTENGNGEVPVYYFTELLAEALGVKE